MPSGTRRRASLLACVALAASLIPVHAPGVAAAPGSSPKLRGDLAALVSGARTIDPRIPDLVAGYQAGEIPYFVYLS